MADEKKNSEEQVFEIIELATDEITLLARAFEMISEVCAELREPEIKLAETVKEPQIN